VIEKHPEVANHLFQSLAGRLDHSNRTIVKLVNERKGLLAQRSAAGA